MTKYISINQRHRTKVPRVTALAVLLALLNTLPCEGIDCYECFNIATIGSRDCLEPTTQYGNVITCPPGYNGCMKATMMAVLRRHDQMLKDWVMFRYCDYLDLSENSTMFLRDHKHYRGINDCAIQRIIKYVLRHKTPYHNDITVTKVSKATIFRCNTDTCNDQHGFKTTEDTVITPNDAIKQISFIDI